MRTLQYLACTFIAYFLFIPCALADDANFYNCKNGFYSCNTAQLTSDQQQVVKENALERNFYNCKNGFYGCNTAQLTSDQQQVVKENALERNFYNCKNGFYGCNTAQLTSDQQQVVKENALERNFYNCKNGFYSCNTAQLTSDQQQVVNSRAAPSQPSVGTACAENGSCYGDISDVTGAPKTTAVRGYYRRDGTYVRGHYRSRRR